MSPVAVAVSLVICGASTVSGVVVDLSDAPVADAQVFLEPGRSAPLRQIETGTNGAFAFDEVDPGLLGVFAYASGYAFGGMTLNVRVAEDVAGLRVALREPESVRGKIAGVDGEPIPKAKVTPLLAVGGTKVGIPFEKLTAFGFAECLSDKQGRFVLDALPAGGAVSLKICHPLYAQEGLSEVLVGENNVQVQLENGMVLEGTALSRDGGVPVANIDVIIRNSRPPHDSVSTRTGYGGRFTVRLKPGIYACQASGSELRSAGWQRIVVGGSEAAQPVRVYVSGIAEVTGNVLDAVSGEPVAGAELESSAFGVRSSVAATGPSGEYRFEVIEGESMIRLQSTPGYLLPDRSVARVTLARGQVVELPTFWVKPIPAFRVEVIDGDGNPAPGVIVTVIRPTQYRWRVTDAAGRVELAVATVPKEGRVLGMAEHPAKPLGALFALERNGETYARVLLLPLATVTGQVTTPKGKGLGGAVVGAVFQEDASATPLPLWRTISRSDGSFEWAGVVPNVAMACVAFIDPDHFGRSEPFALEPAASEDIGRLVVDGGKTVRSQFGRPLAWRDHPAQAGATPQVTVEESAQTLVMYCTVDEAWMAIDALDAVRQILGDRAPVCVAVVDGVWQGGPSSIPVLRGQAPGPATTYLVGPQGKVVLETSGVPPLRALQTGANPP